MGRLWSGGSWLALASVFLGLSLVSTFFVFAFGFDFDPDDHPGSYYEAEIPKRQWMLVISLLVPALSATASVLSILGQPRNVFRISVSVIVLLLALPVLWFCWVIGIDSIRSAIYFAKIFPY
ncbi:hypothetical protein [Arthrobacter crystallopoietes]|uniref:hypothetical protein n=1 Tax=Crystallibacter crystallopoietes TaxID=37928 RepID=UPI0011110554|nr:hypothetical protein [Arthrobacter crystallopoietes]